MQRINTLTKATDKWGAGKHGFTNGNVIGGIPATDLEEAWFDSVQEELAAVIEAMAIALNGNDKAQLLKALRLLGKEAGAPGQVAFFARATPPTGWLKANGAAVSRTAYGDLYAAIGTTYGGGDGSSTFNVPDARGEFLRAWDDGRGVDASRAFGTVQDGTWLRTLVQEWTGNDSVSTGNYVVGVPHANPDLVISNAGGPGGAVPAGALAASGNPWQSAASDNFAQGNVFVDSGAMNRWIRTRPRNMAFLACIKY